MAMNEYGGINMQLGKAQSVPAKSTPRPGAAPDLANHSAVNSTAQTGKAQAPSSEAMNSCR